ncbi:hypothetical protein DFA_10498 [Cavenderia fasciculata]|uniref:Bms1-type G domain-containing protein n=1 Tax=Cavenderia fasciculata TaxID=261658 RepID=F4QAD7_CACFS|nr:uncharacterized protein DFA_10498 [Cavenderia fasciculata]EGG15656.1 hypothetical protein DFA_10498 [Cavenderia fasciculata]|eukprot:XP_004354398.1 hypothetical protein DFA_10498 [Cavenderia fasciculata]
MEEHRHRSGTFKQQNKPFKSGKHDSKGAIKRRTEGKVETRKSIKSLAVVPNRQEILRQKASKMNSSKKADAIERKRLGLPDLAEPRIVSIIPLTDNVNIENIKTLIMTKYGMDQSNVMVDQSSSSYTTLCLGSNGKTRITLLVCNSREVSEMVEFAKVSDIILFAVDVSGCSQQVQQQQFAEFKLDNQAERLLSVIKAQGVPSSMLLMQGFEQVPVKRRNDVKKVITATYHFQFPGEPKVLPIDSEEDAQMVLRFLETMHVNEILWRHMRPYIMIENMIDIRKGSVAIEGYLRGNHLNAKQLIYIPEIGDFQIEKIEKLKDNNVKNQHKNQSDELVLLDSSTLEERESIDCVNVPDLNEQEQTMPSNEEIEMAQKKIRVPKGTSEYQAHWYLDEDGGLQEEAEEDDEDEEQVYDQEMNEDLNRQDEMMNQEMNDDDVDDHPIEGQLAGAGEEEEFEDLNIIQDKWKGVTKDDYKKMLKEKEELEMDDERERSDEQNEMHFPDEIESPEDFPCRIRFSKYRGLKSFRTSPWDARENLPIDYARISQFHSYNQSMRRSIEVQNASPVKYGTLVRITLVQGQGPQATILPTVQEIKARQTTKQAPIIATGLLRYENKVSVLHFSLEKHRLYEPPVKSKEEVVFHVGFRKYSTRPIYSLSAPNCDKQKFEKFLLPGRNAMATIYAPITFVPAPLVVFSDSSCSELVATGRLVSVNPDRIIAKRILLTGRIAKAISRKFAVVRDMFYFPEDIDWFKKVELFTKMGRVGHIRESLGTHGYMKCTFDGTMHQQDTICMSLYKRVFPKWLYDENGVKIN